MTTATMAKADRSANVPQTAPRLLIVARHFPTGTIGVDCYSDDRIRLRCVELLKVLDDARHELLAEEIVRLRLGPYWEPLWSDMHHLGGFDIEGMTPEQAAQRLSELNILRSIGEVGSLLRGERKARAG